MNNKSTLLENLGKLYYQYGGWKAFFQSDYARLSAVITAVCWRFSINENWIESTKVILPAILGFSIAAYAVFFAVLDEKARKALNEPEASLDNRSPLLALVGTVSHATLVQVFAIIFALVYSSRPIPYFHELAFMYDYANIVFSTAGSFLLIYAVVLVISSVLSLFRVVEIRSKI